MLIIATDTQPTQVYTFTASPLTCDIPAAEITPIVLIQALRLGDHAQALRTITGMLRQNPDIKETPSCIVLNITADHVVGVLPCRIEQATPQQESPWTNNQVLH